MPSQQQSPRGPMGYVEGEKGSVRAVPIGRHPLEKGKTAAVGIYHLVTGNAAKPGHRHTWGSSYCCLSPTGSPASAMRGICSILESLCPVLSTLRLSKA